MNTIGERLRALRNSAGWSAELMAAELGVHANTVHRWESDSAEVPLRALLRLEELGFDREFVISGRTRSQQMLEVCDWHQLASCFNELKRQAGASHQLEEDRILAAHLQCAMELYSKANREKELLETTSVRKIVRPARSVA